MVFWGDKQDLRMTVGISVTFFLHELPKLSEFTLSLFIIFATAPKNNLTQLFPFSSY